MNWDKFSPVCSLVLLFLEHIAVMVSKLPQISLANENRIDMVADPTIAMHLSTVVTLIRNMYSIATADKYPIGHFVSNGNL